MNNTQIYAVIDVKTNIVQNVIVLDNENQWEPSTDLYIKSLIDTDAGIGWKFENNNFIDIRPEPVLTSLPT